MVSAIATAAITSMAARFGSVSRTSVGRIGALNKGLAIRAAGASRAIASAILNIPFKPCLPPTLANRTQERQDPRRDRDKLRVAPLRHYRLKSHSSIYSHLINKSCSVRLADHDEGLWSTLSCRAGVGRDRREMVAVYPARPHEKGPAALPGAGDGAAGRGPQHPVGQAQGAGGAGGHRHAPL